MVRTQSEIHTCTTKISRLTCDVPWDIHLDPRYRSHFVYALEFFAAHEPEVLFFLSPALTKMVHAPRTTRYLDSLSRHRILRRAIHCWPRRPSNHRRELRLHPGQFRQPATKSRRRGRPRGAYREGASVFVDVEHILETNQEKTY